MLRARLNLRLKNNFSASPPLIFDPNLAADLGGFSTIEKLLSKLAGDSYEAFPFERELALYLLFIIAIWPDKPERLITAARLFSGGLYFNHRTKPHVRGRLTAFARQYSHSQLKLFEDRFFETIGGPKSLLFCQSAEEFHKDVWGRLGELAAVHDVIEFLIKVSDLVPRFATSRFAFYAISRNVFDRKGVYGVSIAAKRSARSETFIATPETIRAKWRGAPDTILLSFVLTTYFGINLFDPGSPLFFVHLRKVARGNAPLHLRSLLSQLGDQALKHKAKQNSLIRRLGQFHMPALSQKGRFYTLSPAELDRAIAISRSFFKKRGLAKEQEAAARQKLKVWWLEIPGFGKR